jgi:antitoxin VapB
MSATNATLKPQGAPRAQTQPTAAPRKAKLFTNGRSQAVRLPKEFRRDPATGEVILAPAPVEPSIGFDEWFALYDAIPDDASEEEFAKLPPRPRNLTWDQLQKIFARANYPQDFFERHTSMPRKLDLF